MPVSTVAFFMNPEYQQAVGTRTQAYGSQMVPEGRPVDLWGQGTPGAFPPFTTVNKGSTYREVNAADDVAANFWVKVDEGGDAADWVEMGNTGLVYAQSELFDISAGDSEQMPFHAIGACEVLTAGILWVEATGTTGAAEGDLTIGTASGGAQIVTAANGVYTVSSAAGSYDALTISEGTLAAGDTVFASHDQATGAAGTYRLMMQIRLEA